MHPTLQDMTAEATKQKTQRLFLVFSVQKGDGDHLTSAATIAAPAPTITTPAPASFIADSPA
jgi:hypothetical protein